MKKTLKIVCIILAMLLTLIIGNNVKAATVSLSGPDEVTVGDTITVTATVNAAQWNLAIVANGSSLATSSELVNADSNISKTFSATYKATTVGEITFSLTGDYTDIDTTNKDSVAKKVVKVKDKAEESNPVENTTTPSTPTTPTEPEKTVVKEPNFTSASKTMYATGDINLRDSWSTSSNATKINKGTELTVTATSTETVNGYVWYKVSYNGQTKYVAGYLLTADKPEEEKKSNNANLKSLTVENQQLVPDFKSDKTDYTMEVGYNITELNIKAETEDEKAKVSIQGNKELKEGENTVTISVSAEDGTIKMYEIKVTKTEKLALGLATLKIQGTNIDKLFKPDMYEYEVEIKDDVEKLDIEAIANVEDATVEILGNEDLEYGSNFITIMVTSKDEEEKVTYQIKATKQIAQEEVVEENKIDTKIFIYAGVLAVLVIALIIAIVYVVKNRNNNGYDEEEYNQEYDEMPGNLPERIEKDDDSSYSDEPRRRRGKHF